MSALGAVGLPEPDLRGRVVIVTGSNSGIGKETAKALSFRGASVILACRSKDRGEEAMRDIRAAAPDNARLQLSFMPLDLNSIQSIRQFAQLYIDKKLPLHVLVCNAGIQQWAYWNKGFGHFLLTQLLLPVLKASVPSRVVNVSSYMHRVVTSPVIEYAAVNPNWASYERSKLYQVLSTFEAQRRYADSGVSFFVVNPGTVQTEITRTLPGCIQTVINKIGHLFLISPSQGAATSIAAAADLDPKDSIGNYWTPYAFPSCSSRVNLLQFLFESGGPFRGALPVRAVSTAYDEQLAADLWGFSEKWVKEGSPAKAAGKAEADKAN